MTGDYVYRKIRSKALVDRFLQNNLLYKNGFPGELISDGSAIGEKQAFRKYDQFIGLAGITKPLIKFCSQFITLISFYSYLDSFGWRLSVS